MQVEQGDKYLLTKQELENKIATFTGGRAAEEVVFGEITTGASNDIEQATKIARAMITRYGMSDDFDMVAMETVTNQYLGGDASWHALRIRRMRLTVRLWNWLRESMRKRKTFFLITVRNWMSYPIISMKKRRSQEMNLWQSEW